MLLGDEDCRAGAWLRVDVWREGRGADSRGHWGIVAQRRGTCLSGWKLSRAQRKSAELGS